MLIFLENAIRKTDNDINEITLKATIVNDFMYFATNGKIYQVDMITGESQSQKIPESFIDSPIVKLDLSYSETVFHG